MFQTSLIRYMVLSNQQLPIFFFSLFKPKLKLTIIIHQHFHLLFSMVHIGAIHDATPATILWCQHGHHPQILCWGRRMLWWSLMPSFVNDEKRHCRSHPRCHLRCHHQNQWPAISDAIFKAFFQTFCQYQAQSQATSHLQNHLQCHPWPELLSYL